MLLATGTVLSFLLAILLTYGCHFLAQYVDIWDHPDTVRKFHHRATSSLGGIGFGVAFFIWLLFFQTVTAIDVSPEFDVFVTYFSIGAGILFLTGLYDDIYGMSSTPKFMCQGIGAATMILGLIQVYEIISGTSVNHLMYLPLYAFAFLWILTGCNAINLSDGVDALAGTMSIIIIGGIVSISSLWGDEELWFVAVPLISTVLAFLLFNRPPASIFMGDTGSLLLGFSISSLMLYVGIKADGAYHFLSLALMLGLPILDTFMSIIRRLKRGVSPFESDSDHIHHLIQRYFHSPGMSVAILATITFLLTTTSVLLATTNSLTLYFGILGILFLTFVTLLFAYVKKIDQPHRSSIFHHQAALLHSNRLPAKDEIDEDDFELMLENIFKN